MNRRIPLSLLWFALTGAVYLLQALPYTGLFLMLFAAAFWSVLFVNAGFICLALEAVTGRVSRAWLIASIAWFGGYLAFAAANHIELGRLQQQTERQNVGQSIAFSPTSQALSVDIEGADKLVERYDLPRVYQPNHNLSSGYLALSIASQPNCTRLHDPAYRAVQISFFGFRTIPPGLCGVSAPEAPNLPLVTVDHLDALSTDTWLPRQMTNITISDPDGHLIHLVAGRAEALAWWPQPILGCALNDGQNKWQCIRAFGRERPTGLGAPGPYADVPIKLVATALRLRESPLTERAATTPTAPDPRFDGIVEEQLQRSLRDLDGLIANPHASISLPDIRNLHERPDLIATRAEAILSGLNAATKEPNHALESARLFQHLLAWLDEKTFAKLGPRVLKIFQNEHVRNAEFLEDDFIARLGDLGAAAVPTLESLAFDNKHMRDAPVVGLCRAGPVAAAGAERLAADARQQGSRFSSVAVNIALRRMGRPELVVPETRRGRRAQAYAAVTPDSPRSACRDQNDGPWLRDIVAANQAADAEARRQQLARRRR